VRSPDGLLANVKRETHVMATWTPDPTFYPSPRMAARAPAEKLAYVVQFDPERRRADGLAVVDLDPKSKSYAQIVGKVDLGVGDETHHFGWNACSSCLCPNAPHPHVERRYLIVPGIRSSRLHILDTKPDPRQPKKIRTIEADELAERAGYSRPHTVHCGPEGIYVSALGNAEGKAPGGVFLMDHESFDIRGQWEMDRGPQKFAYDFWWHLGHDTMVSSEWGTPDMFENGLIPEKVLGAQYGRRLHFWDLHKRKHVQGSTSATSPSWCSSCARRTTRPRPMASSTACCRSRTCRRRSGPGTGTATGGRPRR
jgi:methanethiol oxidase